jgi:spore maturation protein A
MGAMVMNIVANLMGLGNAATPLGLKAMGELQKLNKTKEKASDAMCMFLIINTCSIQVIPATLIAIRSATGSKNPTQIIMPVWIASICAAITGIIFAKFAERGSRPKKIDN